MNVAQYLKLDQTIVRAYAEAYEGYALAERREPPAISLVAQIDYLVVAASYWRLSTKTAAQACSNKRLNLPSSLDNPGNQSFSNLP